MKDKEMPNYYAVIPATVRYDKSIPAGAKIMYGEITALSNQKGYCYASNTYFSKLYDCTPQAISKWIKQLENAGHVRIEYVVQQGIMQRRVSITVDRYQHELRGVSTTVEGVSTTVEHNNTSNNNTSSNKRARARFQPPTLEEVYSYFLEKTEKENFARREAEKFWNYYESNGWKVGRNKMKSWQHAAGGWLSRCDDYKTNNNESSQNGSNEPKHGIATVESIKRAAAKAAHEIRTAREQADDISDLFAWAEESAA